MSAALAHPDALDEPPAAGTGTTCSPVYGEERREFPGLARRPYESPVGECRAPGHGGVLQYRPDGTVQPVHLGASEAARAA